MRSTADNHGMIPQPRLRCAATLLLIIFCLRISASTLDEWRTRAVYQILTDRFARSDGSTTAECNAVTGKYCGGSWKGIVDKLDYIQGMNFDAIWISPVVAQLPQTTSDGEAYTAYWAQDLYALNPNFGTEADLQDLVKAVHDRGMLLMMDVVVNHMGYAGDGDDVDYSIFNPFDSEKYFHDYCEITDYTNQTDVEDCWLGDDIVALADLDTEDDDVRDMFGSWISELVSNYSVDGLRIDTAINVEPDFFPGFVKSAGIFSTGETMSGNMENVCPWAQKIGSILNYPLYYPLTRAFADVEGSMGDLQEILDVLRNDCTDPTTYGLFSENHDVERFASMTSDMSQAKNIITFTLMGDGIPIIYQGQEQHMKGGTSPYTNRRPLWETEYDTNAELYLHIATLNKARQHIVKTSGNYTTYIQDVIYQDYHSIVLRKGFEGGQVVTVFNNNGEDTNDFEIKVSGHDYSSGTSLTEILTCSNVTIDKHDRMIVQMGAGLPKVIIPTDMLHDSGLCGNSEAPPSSTTAPLPTAIPTTISGHSTMIAGTGSASKPSHTRLALGSARQQEISFVLPLVAAAITIIFGASAAFTFPMW